jgi:hypothetical protein
MEETRIEPEFEERLHALNSNTNSLEANYQVEDPSVDSVREGSLDHLSLGSRPISSPRSPISRENFSDFYLDQEGESPSQVVESDFTRQLRLLESVPEVNSAPILEEKEEPNLKCSCDEFDEDLSAGGVLCATCQSAGWIHYLQCRDSFGVLEFGSIQDVRLRKNCLFCQMVWLAVEQEWKEDGWTAESKDAETRCYIKKEAVGYVAADNYRANMWVKEGWIFRLLITLENEPEAVKKGQEALKRMGVQPRLYVFLHCWIKEGTMAPTENPPAENPIFSPQPAEILTVKTPAWADLTKIRERLSDCEAHHGECCKHDSTKQLPGLRLIDVNELRVVDAPASPRYFALSYVWGEAQGKCLNATKSNIAALRQAGSLSGEPLGASLSFSIEDAIRVCWEFEEQYLWVDSLCIIQDDPEDKAKQIGIMEEIYSASVLTLVAAGGEDAESGLPGVFHWPRDMKTSSIQLGDVELRTNSNPSTALLVQKSIWNTRGWTYQERMLSTRLLFFTACRASLSCSQGQMDEEGDLLPDLGATGVNHDKIYRLSKNDVSFEDYLRIVHEYTSRQLRYRSDALNTFSGISRLISTTQFSSNFLYGLPERYFDQSLLWRRWGPPNIGFPSDTSLPSWSWASGDGPILYAFQTRIGSLVDWWIQDGSGGIRRINVEKSSLGDGHDESIQKYTKAYQEDDITFQHGRGRQLKSPVGYYSRLKQLISI